MPVLILCYSTLFVGVRVFPDLLLGWVNQKRKSQSIESVEICIAHKKSFGRVTSSASRICQWTLVLR